MAKLKAKLSVSEDARVFIILLIVSLAGGTIMAKMYDEKNAFAKGFSLSLLILLLFLIHMIRRVYSPFTKVTGVVASVIVTFLVCVIAWFVYELFVTAPSEKEGEK